MKIHVFVSLYPVPFKPYYDTQFATLVEEGHDVTIFSGGRHGEELNEKVVEAGLDRRVRHYPTVLRHLPRTLGRAIANAVRHPSKAWRALRLAVRNARGVKQAIVDTLRAWTVLQDDPDLCLVHGTGTAVRFPWLKEIHRSVPIALYYHGGEVPSVSKLEQTAVADAFRMADAVFTNTEFSRDHAVSRGCPPDRIHILPVGFDLRDYQVPEEREYRKGGTLRLLSAGRMSEEKGFIFALKALRHLVHEKGITDLHYSLTGEGYIKPELERFVRENDLEPYVTFLGTVTTEELIRQQGEADVLLLPSVQVGNWVENQACAVQETMLMKGLVVVSRTGGVPESVAPALRDFIVEEGDWRELAEAIERIDEMSKQEFSLRGNKARAFVIENYDVRELNMRLLRITLEGSERSEGISTSGSLESS